MAKPGPRPGTPAYKPPRPIKDRILSRIEVDTNGCWNWTGPRTAKGYGHTFIGSRVDGTRHAASTHRLAYEAWKGSAIGKQIDHLCRNTSCCNPDHLELVTNAENMRRAKEARGTCANGHPWTPENTHIRSSGRRDCRACKRESGRRAYAAGKKKPWRGSPRPCAWCGEMFEPTDSRTVCCSRSCAKTMYHRKTKPSP